MEKSKKAVHTGVSRTVLVRELAAFEKRLNKNLDSRFAISDKRMDKRMDARFETFEERLVQRVEARLDSRLDMQTESLKLYVNGRFTQVNDRFDKLEGRFDNLEGRFDNLEGRVDKLEGSLDNLDKKVDKLGKKIDVNTAGLVEMFERGFGEVLGVRKQVDNHETRISSLESKSIS
jgi:chromosome segregation ATPase